MTALPVVFLGLIALATVTMAILQVGAVLYASRLARRMEQLTAQVEQDIKPLLRRLTDMTNDAARVAAIAAGQAERVDALLADLTTRVEQTVAQLQSTLLRPAQQGLAVVSAIRAVVATLCRVDLRRHAGVDDEDPLFIG